MNINLLPAKIARPLNRIGFKLKKKSPEIFIVMGVAGVIGGSVMACRATTKAVPVVTEAKEKIREAHENADLEEKEARAELNEVYIQTGVTLVKLYAPAVIVTSLSLSSIIGSHHIMRERNASLAAAYATVSKSFKEYRERVAERYGEETERDIRFNTKKEKVEKIVEDPKTGKTKKVTETVTTGMPSEYAKFFDEGNEAWQKDPELNLLFLRGQQRYANDMLHAQGHLFLNEVYDLLNIDRTKAGQTVGWLAGKDGSGYVDFGLYDIRNASSRRFVNGDDWSILLDFNVQGDILNAACK